MPNVLFKVPSDPSCYKSTSITNKSQNCSDLIASESSAEGISRSGKWLFMLHCRFWRCLLTLMKTVLSPKENRWATVQVCERAFTCVFVCSCVYIWTLLSTGLPLLKHMCMDVGDYFTLSSSTACKCSILYLSAVYMYVCVCVYTIKGFGGLRHSENE